MKYEAGDEVLIRNSRDTDTRCRHFFDVMTPVTVAMSALCIERREQKYLVISLDDNIQQFVKESELITLQEIKKILIDYDNFQKPQTLHQKG